jgi:hypothetical protein
VLLDIQAVAVLEDMQAQAVLEVMEQALLLEQMDLMVVAVLAVVDMDLLRVVWVVVLEY